jgi:hypothetical protein
MLACAETEDDNGDIDIGLVSANGTQKPTDADLDEVFGSVPGTLYNAERTTVLAYNSASQSAVESYLLAFQGTDFSCDSNDCFKQSGSMLYGLEIEIRNIGGNDIMFIYWYVSDYSYLWNK